MADTNEARDRYWCVVGHEIRKDRLHVETEVQVLDQGAEICVCVEHGAPIALRKG